MCWASQVVLVVKNSLAKAGDIGDVGSTLGLGRYHGGGHGNLLQYSCLENPIDRGAWQVTVHGITKSGTQLKQFSRHSCGAAELFDVFWLSFPFTGVYNSCVWYFSCWFLKLRNKFYYVGLAGLGLAGSRDLGFGFPWDGGIPRPHRVTWSRPINIHPVKAGERAEKPAGA